MIRVTRSSCRRDLITVGGLTLLAGAVRVPTLSEQSFWLDEAYSVRLVRMSFGGMLHGIRLSESTPPLYYVLAWCWTRIFGSSEFGLRSLSALAGILTVAAAYALALRLAGRRAAVVAGILVALSPLLIWYSQEARAYALAALLSTVSLTCFVGFLDTGVGGWLAGWTASSALGVASHYFVAFLVGPELVWLIWRYRRDRRVAVAVAAVLAVAVALLPLALEQRGAGHADYIASGSLITRLIQIPKQFLVGYATPAQVISAVLAALLAGFGLLEVLRRRRSRLGRRAMIPLIAGALCVLLPVCLALAGVDFVNTRNVLPALPLILVAVAIGFTALAGRPATIGLAGVLALVFIVVVTLVDANPRYQRDNWRGALAALGDTRQARVIVVEGGLGEIVLEAYRPDLRPLRRAAVTELDVVALPLRTAGGGLARSPRLTAPLAVPGGFRLTHVTRTATYTVARYRAPDPIAVTAASLAAIHLGATSSSDLMEPRPAATASR